MKKRRNTKLKIFSLVLGMVLCIGTFVGCSKGEYKGVTLSAPISHGSTLYDFEDIQNQKVTLRQPFLEVLERGLPRSAPEVMSDTFTLPSNFSTGELSTATYTFDPASYPAATGRTKTMTVFEKYMLLRQAMYYGGVAQDLAENGLMKKHPAADRQYGSIPVEDNAVKKRIVTDPEYTGSIKKYYLTTGLYLPAGEVATVKVKGLKSGERLRLFTGLQQSIGWAVDFNTYDNRIIEESKKANPDYESLDIKVHGHIEGCNVEIAYQMANFYMTENEREYKIGCIFGGALYIDCSNLTTAVEIEITGCVETPHFILGVTSVDEFEEYLRNAPGLLCSLDVENGQLIGPAAAMRQTDDILKVAYMWHSNFAINVSLLGRVYNYPNILRYDTYVPAGAAVALSGQDSAMPSSDMYNCLNFANLKARGEWMTFHELGHQHANQGAFGKVYGMEPGVEGEVRNNVLILLNYALTCNINPNQTSGVEHGEYTHPYNSLLSVIRAKNKFEDYSNAGGDPFWCLGLYSVILHQFGPEKFLQYIYSHAEVKNYNEVSTGTNRSEFAYRLIVVYGMDFRKFLNEYFSANITNDMFSKSQLKKMSKLKEFVPIACKFSNGVGDARSAGAHVVSAGAPTEFELSNNIISTGKFTIVSVTKPKYGTIKKVSGTKYIYTPPKKLVNGDVFGVVCQLSNGLLNMLPIRLEFSYKNSKSKVWEGVSATTLQDAIDNSKEVSETRVEYSAVAGKASFNSGNKKDYVETTFSYVAPQTGTYRFYLKSDDIGRVDAKKDGETYTIKTTAYTANYQSDNYFELNLLENEVVPFTTYLLNAGGVGSLNVGVLLPEQIRAVDIPSSSIILPNYDSADLKKIQTFGWQPKFLTSVKNFTKSNYVSKDGWEIVSAPSPHGNIDPNVLVDGDINTIYHSNYTNSSTRTPMPHIYILDMKKSNKINFFEIYTRNNSNSCIVECELYGSTDGKKYSLLKKIDSLTYSNRRAVINFDMTSARYLKLVVKKTTGMVNGDYFSVISELNAGFNGVAEYVISPSANEIFHTKGFETNGNSGSVVSTKKDSTLVTKFKGTNFNIYANTFEDAGSFEVYIDGKLDAKVNLSGDEKSSQLVYASGKLKNKNHTIEIKTKDNKGVEIKYMSLNYGATMLNVGNIYKERALGIALAIFCVLFVLTVVFMVLYFTLPKFREWINNLFKLEKQTSPETLAKKAKKKEEKQKKRDAKKAEKQNEKGYVSASPSAKKVAAKKPQTATKKPTITTEKTESKGAKAKTTSTSAKKPASKKK